VSKFGHVQQCKIKRDLKGRSEEEAIILFRDDESAVEAKKEIHSNINWLLTIFLTKYN
jgi:hypothetical protein